MVVLNEGETAGQVNKAPQTTPTLLVRQSNNNAASSPFIAVFENHDEAGETIQSVQAAEASATFVRLRVEAHQRIQTIYQSTNDSVYQISKRNEFQGKLGVVSREDGALEYIYLGAGQKLKDGKYELVALEDKVTAELRSENGQLYYSSNGPIRIAVKKGKLKEYPKGLNVLIEQ